MEDPQENWLAIAIRKLKAAGTIKRDKDVADATGYSKESLSNMLSGRSAISAKFKTKFESVYGKFEKRTGLNQTHDDGGIPIYDAIATGSGNENVSQLSGRPLFKMELAGYEDCKMGIYYYGHSMYPTIESGCLILLKPVNDKTVIMYGEIYLVRTNDYFMVKRLQKGEEKGNVLCTSDNFEKRTADYRRFEPFEVPIDKIIDLYLIKGIIKKTQS